MSAGLREKAVSASFWSVMETFAHQGLQFGITLVLARLLTPAEYGTVAMLSIFIGLAGVFVESGFSSALIQRKEVTDTDLSSVFYFNVAMSVLAASLLCLSSPWIASFYGMPVLQPLTCLLACGLIIGAFGAVQRALLARELNFRRQCAISIVAMSLSGAAAIWMAFHGYGVWSLAASSIIGGAATAILLWILSSWRPQRAFSPAAIHSLFRFGSFLLLSNLLNTLFSRLYELLIGKLYSAGDLGYYSRADHTRSLPATTMSTMIGRVAFPIFSAARGDKTVLKAGLRKAISLVMLVNVPAMLGLTVVAKPTVLILFGDQWLPCVPYLQILCIGGAIHPLHVMNLHVLTALGHSNLFFRIELLKKIVSILLIGTACFIGITAIAWSAVFAGIICFVLNAYYSGRFLGYGTLAQIVDILPYCIASVIMAMFAWSVGYLIASPAAPKLIAQVSAGAIVYCLVGAAFRLKGFQEAWKLARHSVSHHVAI